MIKKLRFCLLVGFAFLASSCDDSSFKNSANYETSRAPVSSSIYLNKGYESNLDKEKSVPVYAKGLIKTQKQAAKLDLELPLRCDVDWENQQLVQRQVLSEDSFFVERVNKGDALPELMLTDITFEDTNSVEILTKILFGTDIKIYAQDDVFENVSVSGLKGDLETVVSFIAKLGNFYYSYDERQKILTLSKSAKWNLHIPFVKEVVFSLEDALRGIGVENLIVDWEDKVIITSGDFLTERKIKKVLDEFKKEETLIVYDVDIYRVYTKDNAEIPWFNMMQAFRKNTIKVSVGGILGRAVSVSSNLNKDTLKDFLEPNASPVLISRGKFVTPNRWQGRFDIGRCSRDVRLETDLAILTQANFKERQNKVDKMDLDIILRTTRGDITSFNLPTRVGENILVFGIPTHYFVRDEETIIPPNTELVILLSPRIIKIN